MNKTSRRQLLAGAAVTTGAALLAKQYDLIPPDAASLYGCGHTLTYAAQRLLIGNAQAREFKPSQITKVPHQKGSPPKAPEYRQLQANGFKDWTLQVDGLVTRPATFSMDQLKTYPKSTQITQLICEEGWSYIAEWSGVPLAHILEVAGAQPQAKYVVYYSMDNRIEAIDMDEARHPQTLVAHGMNGGEIPVGHGGPLRLRAPRQLGYKNRKFLTRITLTESLTSFPMNYKYSWYAGI